MIESVGSSSPVRRILDKGPVSLVLWAVGLAAWIYLVIATSGRLLQVTVWSVPFFLMLVGLSLPWRTVSWRTAAGFFLLGMGPVFVLVALSQVALSPLDGWVRGVLGGLGVNYIRRDIWAPLTEEFFKIMPLLVLVRWRGSGFKDLAGPLDYAVVAGATGVGMGFAEDILVMIGGGLAGPPSGAFGLGLGRFYQAMVGAESSGFLLSGRSKFADVGSFLFPEMQEFYGVIWIGHGALAMGIGIACGLAVWQVRRSGKRIFYLIPVGVYAWAVFEHMMTNWYGGGGCGRDSSPLCLLASLDFRGRLFPLAVILGWAFAIYLSRNAIKEHRVADPLLARKPSWSGRVDGPLWRRFFGRIRDQFEVRRWRRRTAFGAFHLENSGRLRPGQDWAVLASRTRTLILYQRLAGEPTVVPASVEAALEALVPLD